MNERAIHILLVEDDLDDAYIVKQLLLSDRKRQFCVTDAGTIDEFKKISDLLKVDLILLDLNLDDVKGLETLLVCRDIAKSVPIIVLSGLDDECFGENIIQLGAQDFIPKAELTRPLLIRAIRFALERHQLIQALKEQANTDELTLLYNRRYFNEQLTFWQNYSQRHNTKFALLIYDLNKFKEINDVYGHDAGDQVLSQIASRIRMDSRRKDIIARIGGDEFAAIVPEYGNDDDLHAMVKRSIETISSKCYIMDEGDMKAIKVEVSVGIAIYPEDSIDVSELLIKADAAMYATKKASYDRSAMTFSNQLSLSR